MMAVCCGAVARILWFYQGYVAHMMIDYLCTAHCIHVHILICTQIRKGLGFTCTTATATID